MKKFDDIDLLLRFKDGDLPAFEEFVIEYQDRIFNLCRYMLGNARDAEDAAQDVFIKAYQRLNDFRPEASLYTWLYRIGVNTCLDYKKKSFLRILNHSESKMNSLPGKSTPEEDYQSKETAMAINRALAGLPEKLRTTIVLREIELLSYEDIAEILNTSIGTVKSRISRARELLSASLKSEM
jgi:RNA polymerase sigma-70 factor (ECF subfamily)